MKFNIYNFKQSLDKIEKLTLIMFNDILMHYLYYNY